MNPLNWLAPDVTERQVMALAGISQAVETIDSLAETGHCDSDNYRRNLLALLDLEPAQDEDIFGKNGELDTGLRAVQSLSGGSGDARKVRYVAQIIYLQKRLMKRPQVLEEIAEGIGRAKRKYEFSGGDSDGLSSLLADLYQETLSTLGYRIQIFGKHEYLAQPHVAAQVRTMLLSGVRFSLLWRQLGGRSIQLLVSKKPLIETSKKILQST